MHPFYSRAATMIGEIAAAVSFISKFLRTKGLTSERQLQTFSQSLQELLAEHYKHHWFPEKPCKGSGYRCIRINHKMDPLIGQAAQRIGLSSQELFRLLPSELTLWVDPYEVSYRIGEDGSICVLYEASPAGGECLGCSPRENGNEENGGGIQAESPKPVCKELMIAKESKDLRDESYSFYEREKQRERDIEKRKSFLLKFEENKGNMCLGSAEYGFDSGCEVHAVLITSCSSLLAVMW
ncbi:hypothetical protein JEQ12_014282 [Ovis aries]|uniref:Protein BTG1 n=1 Tax=Ovis aries TaxID=9940 RepID=A0A836D3Z7_SHEEP|nr:hypothetical protein JEQ12_014282 [Ovis aries]